MAFAALGAAEVLRAHPEEPTARSLERDCARVLMAVRDDAAHAGHAPAARPAAEVADAGAGVAPDTGGGRAPVIGTGPWRWPEARLAYGNGTVAEALIVAGVTLDDGNALARGLDWLDFLLQAETGDGHLSVTPVAGRGPADAGPGFDQQPIEVASLADACASAFTATGDVRWLSGVHLAWRWFLGDNDSATPMFDPVTGGGYDGLLADGRNLNQGAESTLAMLSTAQHARRFNGVASPPDKH
jgi:hypothetical protein